MSGEAGATAPQEQAQVLQIVAQIISLVEERRYLPGERILSVLESMRFLERRRGSGVFMASNPDATSLETLVLAARVGLPLSNKVNQDSIEVRRIIEVQAIALACERRTDADVVRLRAILDAYDPIAADALAASDYDARFHLGLIASTGNEILVRLVQPFYLMSRLRREAYFTDVDRRSASHAQHLQMAALVEARDVAGAEELMSAHIGRVDDWFHATYA
jgi:GntR family transcriptional regulator, transcriptional repressor for pyruvate dehydrogenase complex